jgi:hypothetical protein
MQQYPLKPTTITTTPHPTKPSGDDQWVEVKPLQGTPTTGAAAAPHHKHQPAAATHAARQQQLPSLQQQQGAVYLQQQGRQQQQQQVPGVNTPLQATTGA